MREQARPISQRKGICRFLEQQAANSRTTKGGNVDDCNDRGPEEWCPEQQ